MYGSRAYIEKVLFSLFFIALKRFLGVDQRTPGPARKHFYIRALRYLLKIIRINSNRLPRRAYNMLIKLDERDKNTWATEIRLLLYTHGFGFGFADGIDGLAGEEEELANLVERLHKASTAWRSVPRRPS